MARIRIITDGRSSYGFGNLRRTASLVTSWRNSGHDVMVELLSDEAISLFPAPRGQEGTDDIWLLDLPYDCDIWVEKARALGRPVAALDYTGRRSPDLVISV